MSNQGKKAAKGTADTPGCLLGGGASSGSARANRAAAPIQVALTRYGSGSPKLPKFDVLVLECMKAAKSFEEKAQLMLMSIAFVYHIITEDLVNLEEDRSPDKPFSTVPADARKSMKLLANHITDLAEELATAEFKGFKDEHDEMREAVVAMTGAHNKNNRLSPSEQDATTAECALAHLMNLNGAVDIDILTIKIEHGARARLFSLRLTVRTTERLRERLRANAVGQFFNSKLIPTNLDGPTLFALARANSTAK